MPFLSSAPASPPRRIVSLCPSVTETLDAFGAWDRVVGRTRYCVRPQGLVQAVRHVGGTKNPDLHAVAALRPDLVVAVKEENRREDIDELVGLGLPVLLLDPRSLPGAAAAARELGDAIDCPIEGELLARRIERVAAAAARNAEGRLRPRVACLVWWEPAMLVGTHTYIHALLEAVGLDVVAPAPRYPEVRAEDLADLGLDGLLLPSEPFPFRERHVEELVAATQIPPERVRLVDGELLSWHGARTPAGIEAMAAVADALRAEL